MSRFNNIILIFTLMLTSLPAFAQSYNAPTRQMKEIMGYAEAMGKYCANGNWETSRCLDIIAKSNTVLVANYMAQLMKEGHNDVSDQVKDACAAATQVNKVKDLPTNALTESYTICMNGMFDASSAASLTPDKTHYQLLMAANFCTQKYEVCATIENEFAKIQK